MNFFTTQISNKAKELVNDVLNSTFISAGKMADKFENELQNKLGLCNPVTVNSGTSALHLALAVAGVGIGDEVILPAQTFIATGFVIMMQGATPVFADIQVDSGNIDPESFRKKITAKTKAIIPVHWAGYPCDLDEINKIAKENNIAVIEDAAHALGAIYKGKKIGAISRFTAFSFQAIKHVTSGDGGALTCLNDDDFYQAKRRRWFDIDRENSTPDILGERIYDATSIGYKYHMNDLAAAIALGNLEDFEITERKIQKIAKIYQDELKNVNGLKLLEYKSDRKSAFWLFTVLVEKRIDFITALRDKGVPASVVHLRIDDNTVFGGRNEDLVNQAKFNELQVSIPIHANLNEEEVYGIVSAIKNGW